jgi:hypothetical protein
MEMMDIPAHLHQHHDNSLPDVVDGAQVNFEGALLISLSSQNKTKNYYQDNPARLTVGDLDQPSTDPPISTDPACHAVGDLNHQPSTNPSIATEYSIPPDLIPRLDNLKTSMEFQRALESASLDNGDLDVDNVYRLRHPIQNVFDLHDAPDLLFSLRLFLSTTSASDQVYNDVRSNILNQHPEDNVLSLAAVKTKIQDLTGIVPIVHDMCPNSCVAYTGPFSDLDKCPVSDCQESRYNPILLQSSRGNIKKPQQQFSTMPLDPSCKLYGEILRLQRR